MDSVFATRLKTAQTALDDLFDPSSPSQTAETRFATQEPLLSALLFDLARSLSESVNHIVISLSRQPLLLDPDRHFQVCEILNDLSRDLVADVNHLLRHCRHARAGQPPDRVLVTEIHGAISFHRCFLLLVHTFLNLEAARRDFNRAAQLKDEHERLAERETALNHTLKTVFFECPAADILPSRQVSTSSDTRSSSLPFSMNINVATLLLQKLHAAANDYSPQFPHDVNLAELMAMILHWWAVAWSSSRQAPGLGDEDHNGSMYWSLVKSCWLLYCTGQLGSLRKSDKTVQVLVSVLVGLVMDMFDTVKTRRLPRASTFVQYDASICRPEHALLHTTPSQQSSGASIANSSSSQNPTFDLDRLSLVAYEPTLDEEEISGLAMDDQPSGHKPGFYREVCALGPYRDRAAVLGTEPQPCYVRVFRDRTVDGAFNIRTSLRGQDSHFSTIRYQKPTTLIPEYAYSRNSQRISFLGGSSNPHERLAYQFGLDSEDVFLFHQAFTPDTWLDTFMGLNRAIFRRGSSPALNMSDPMVQLWRENPVQAPGSSSVPPFQQPPSLSSFTSAPSRERLRRTATQIEPVLIKYSPSKLMLFGNNSIYTLFITENIKISLSSTSQGDIVEIRPTNGQTHLRVHVQPGSHEAPAGVPLGGRLTAYDSEPSFTRYTGIDLFFEWDVWSKFQPKFRYEQAHWEQKRQKIHAARRKLKNPDIKTRSVFDMGSSKG